MVGRSTMPPATRHDPEDRTKTQVEDRASERKGRVLVFWEGGSAAAPLPPAGQISFGRATDCDVPIDHASVSRRHALLHVGAVIAIEDLGSSNGTRVAGQRIAPRVPMAVAPGDLVEIGGAMMLLEHPGAAAETQRPLAGQVGVHAAAAAGAIIQHESMLRVFRLLELVAPSHLSVIVLGETGVGKELAAQAVHQRSARAQRPFVRLNCAALPEALLESELFGHERGAFTGALTAKPGLLEAAEGGTVFLDEVAELPLSAQAKLLRALESRELLRVGGLAPRPIDVRFVAATHRDLPARVADGSFRQDLYFRLNGVSITIPPLRERTSEIGPLAAAFAAGAAAAMGRAAPALRADAMDLLLMHPWPGNIRELRNVIERAVVVCLGDGRDTIGVEDLPAELFVPHRGATETPAPVEAGLQNDLDALERRRILDALERCGGHQGRAAEMLGISRRTLLSRLDSHGLPRPRKGQGPVKR